MIKAILFDLDGTLLDRDSSLRQFVSTQHERLAALHHIPKERYLARFIELDCHGHVWKDVVYQKIAAEFDVSAMTWEELLEDYKTCFARSAVPFPGLVFMLDALVSKGHRLGLVSNGMAKFQWDVIRALDIERFFDAVLISEAEGIRKPEMEIFKRALQRLDAAPEQAVFVGDHPDTDIAGARRAGMKTVWMHNSVWGEPAEVDATIESLGELAGIIQSLE